MAKYYSIMTDVGLAATANAAVLGKKINLATFAVGDGGGAFYSPVPTMTALRGQKWSGPISGYNVSADSPNLISVTGLIPSDVGGWTIREIGVFDDQGRLIAIANYPDTEKISRDDGVSTEIQVGIELLLSNASSVTIQVDPTMILATKAEVNVVQDNLNTFKKQALTGGKLGSTALTVNGNALIIPAATEAHDGYMSKEQAAQLAGTVPNTRKINNHALTGDFSLTASDVGARPSTWMPTAIEVGARPSNWSPDLSGVQLKSENPTAGRAAGTTLGDHAVCLGYNNTASEEDCVVCGGNGNYAIARGATILGGAGNWAKGFCSTILGVIDGEVTGAYGSILSGMNIQLHDSYGVACGANNKISNGQDINFSLLNDAFLVGNGNDYNARSNAFRGTFAGDLYMAKTYHTNGADYSEYFEWSDKNSSSEDRVGRFGSIEGEKITYAKQGDCILGITSGEPAIIGDDPSESWQGRYVRDIFGRIQMEEVQVPEQVMKSHDGKALKNPDGTDMITPAHTETRFEVNPNYDSAKENEYENREKRPEWSTVGMLGKLVLIDDGTCTVNGYCQPSTVGDGTATKADNKTSCRVMSRLDSTHIRVLLK